MGSFEEVMKNLFDPLFKVRSIRRYYLIRKVKGYTIPCDPLFKVSLVHDHTARGVVKHHTPQQYHTAR